MRRQVGDVSQTQRRINDLGMLGNHFATNSPPVADEEPIDRRLIADQLPIGRHGIAKSSHSCLDETDRRTVGNQICDENKTVWGRLRDQ